MLKELLWLVGDVPQGRVLDLGPVWQSTVTFFTDRGFRVSSEDLLRSWREYLRAEEARLRNAPVGQASSPMEPAALAARFLQTSLHYPTESFHAVLAWDVFDYLDAEMLPSVSAALHALMRPGAAMLALFHSQPPAVPHRYRIQDFQTLELIPAVATGAVPRILQNRDILKLFAGFRSTKTIVGRDQLREGLILK